MLIPRFVVRMLSVGLMVLGSGVVSGQDYPNRPIHIITSGIGGGSDFVARQVSQGISGPLGQPVIVDNRGSGMILYESLAKAPPDGYGLVLTGTSFYLFPLFGKVPYDVARDFSPISLISREVNILAVHPSVPAKSVKELIALAKAKPGTLNYGSGGIGSLGHLGMELFKSMAGIDIVNVIYKGQAARNTALIIGEVHLTIIDTGTVMPHVKSGKLRALAVANAEPSVLVPGLPTVAASGLPGYELKSMTGIYAPGKTPTIIINRLNREIVRVLNRADVKERFLSHQEEIVGSSAEEFAATIKSEITKWSKVIKDAGIKVE